MLISTDLNNEAAEIHNSRTEYDAIMLKLLFVLIKASESSEV